MAKQRGLPVGGKSAGCWQSFFAVLFSIHRKSFLKLELSHLLFENPWGRLLSSATHEAVDRVEAGVPEKTLATTGVGDQQSGPLVPVHYYQGCCFVNLIFPSHSMCVHSAEI